ncbi:hypothetical protein AGABI1DRAFT_74463 [Agaricus bisporus var. burnettii JB137-S8]|uniref:POP1-domain-containing protein n=1 Tax=Agaricus bisporus var. burnettii (strain JB137-S8 / ATCC MYA-4627 / FGSC 10392) TaxID=597362 RepID=K5VY65_AGABU|nr:uncharacterized protein AGABI1DRAFT_74463 [Agaricus bisporus var. burnettii JB137-S8]EKM79429.1 hypothetical protein AGABI1DRAFT_74463 [Agaricus bisporus var. burnettii JB137-S8]
MSHPGNKRKNGGDEMSGRDKKKLKMNAARTIPVQSVPMARGSGSGIIKGMSGLPSAIDVEKFAEARAYEIDAMEKAMKNASGASTQRAWQALPRHLRRRAASHDVRRVPAKLRGKAKAEASNAMDPPSKKVKSRKLPKAGKNKKISKTESFQKRQRDKSWLETHLWHAKRMKMENMWGYRLAVQPTEKSYRPSHRASIQGSIIHDASYFATLKLKGPQFILEYILGLICDLQGAGAGATRWVVGSRAFNTHLHKCDFYPFGCLGPATIIWRPLQKNNEPSTDCVATTPDNKTTRNLWLRVHPAIFEDVTVELKKAVSRALDRPRPPPEEFEVEIADLRGQVNAFEIMGPKSNQVLRGALDPISKDDRNVFKQFWMSLSKTQSPSAIPRDMIIGASVIDPRLKFPPKNAHVEYKEESSIIYLSTELARSDIWEHDIRKTLSKPRYTKKDIDDRRSKNLVPGTPLKPERQDDRVPILLIRRTLEAPDAESQSISGYTLLFPAGWSMAFWSSLIYTGTRVGGQRERQTQAYEAGVPYFPCDFPFSLAYEKYADEREIEERDTWTRKPPAKRVNYQKLGVRSPWRADWEVVLGLKEATSPFDTAEGEPEDLVSTQRDDRMDTDPATNLLKEVNKLRQKRDLEPLNSSINPDALLKHALINVRVTVFKEGVPEDMAMIYQVSDEEATNWERLVHTREDRGGPSILQLANKRPPQEDIIGYVTTGHYSLSRGKGFAIGAVPLTKFLELRAQQSRLHPLQTVEGQTLLVKVRNINGQQCRPAHLRTLEC